MLDSLKKLHEGESLAKIELERKLLILEPCDELPGALDQLLCTKGLFWNSPNSIDSATSASRASFSLHPAIENRSVAMLASPSTTAQHGGKKPIGRPFGLAGGSP